MAAAVALLLPLSAFAEVDVQNAQYRADKGAVYVKGKVGGDGAARVYVLNARTNRQIGSINTQAKGTQFGGEIDVAENQVPCQVKVQTNAPSRFGRFFGGGGGGDFTIATVTQAPENCN